MTIFSMNSADIQNFDFELQQGQNVIQLNSSMLAPGTYLIQFELDGTHTREKIVVQHKSPLLTTQTRTIKVRVFLYPIFTI